MSTFIQAIQICGLDDLKTSQFFGVPLSSINDCHMQLDAPDDIVATDRFLQDGISLPDQSARKMAGAARVLISVFEIQLV